MKLGDAECISYQELLASRSQSEDPSNFGSKYSLEQIRSYVLQPGDNWTDAIAAHAKIVLDPQHLYVLDSVVSIRGLCYVIGNGARVVVRSDLRGPVFNVRREGDYVRVRHMGYVTFKEVNFECGDAPRSCLFDFRTHALFHGCNFNTVRGVALQSMCELVVRGCNFYGCHTAIRYTGHVTSGVRCCHFERCLVAIKASGPMDVISCSSMYCACFWLTSNGGRLQNCTIMRCLEFGEHNFVTCMGGTVGLLCSVHLVSQGHNPFPYIYRTRIQDGSMYFGYRRGSCYAKQSVFAHAHLYVHGATSQKLVLTSCHLHSVATTRLLPECVQQDRLKRCECGEQHVYHVPLSLPCEPRHNWSEVRLEEQPADSLEFDSDSEDD